MAEAISDKHVVSVLRPFVRATGPVVDALREADPFGLVARASVDSAEDSVAGNGSKRARLLEAVKSVKVPGTKGWAAMDTEQRTGWWVNRVGRFTSLVTAVPGLGGALADRFPIQDTLGAASQGLLLCAIAGERGVTDVGDRVRLLAWVLFEREVSRELAQGTAADRAAEDAETAKLTEELESAKKRGSVTLKTVARTLWRLGRSLLGVTDELEKRPSGRFYHQALGMLPVVGMVGGYLGERSGLKRVAKRANKWFAREEISNART
ncbi:hypothetical protein [Prauserella cavernicola]|uniref:Uncharacterized protein n=1 Tax=Prauserella cavernicola TaxID=2800127 RepID=A0A934V5G5_9PSEU|nr:hypothetical protein [Prauserella cavernicola]MBK1785694.1 hypothetical protein [Prauserella cavernicola]